MSVTYVRPEVSEQMARWQLVRDVLAGQDAVKAAGVKYLPMPNASDQSPDNRARYQAYVDRAVFYAVTGRTLGGLVGQVFAREPEVEIPDEMDGLKADVDGAGVALDQQARKALSFVLGYGRGGLLSDYPPSKVDEEGKPIPASQADLDKGFVRPTVTLYAPWDVINWRTVTVGARRLLSLVVISELATVDDDGFEAKTEQQYRVLRLIPPAAPENAPEGWQPDYTLADYVVEIWKETTDEKGAVTGHAIMATYRPTDADGQPLREIPFTFIGALNNDPSVDHPPIYDLATLNVAHYRNSADYEEVCYLLGQPTPWISGITQAHDEQFFKGKNLMLGSRAWIPLPPNGSAGLLQIEPNSMIQEAMASKERQMVALGAKLVEQRAVQRTAQEAGQEAASESSILSTVARNVSAAYTDALRWCADFMGAGFPEATPADGKESDPQEIRYELNSDFPASKMGPADLAALVDAWQKGGLADSEFRSALKKGGLATLDLDQWRDEKDQTMPDLSSMAAGVVPPVAAGEGDAGMMGGEGQAAA